MGLRELFDNFDSDNDGALAQGEMERLARTLANPQNWRSMQNMQNREPIQSFGQSSGAVMNLVTNLISETTKSVNLQIASYRCRLKGFS